MTRNPDPSDYFDTEPTLADKVAAREVLERPEHRKPKGSAEDDSTRDGPIEEDE